MISGLVARHTLSRERPNRVSDGRGGFEDDWTDVEPVDLKGWALDAGASQEDLQNRDGSLIQYTARGPMTADVQTGDRITFNGEQYQIDGAPVKQPGPSPVTSHIIMLLRRWEG
ncbi:MAG: head-tail adaptor protein [Homoserinimonas sp.]